MKEGGYFELYMYILAVYKEAVLCHFHFYCSDDRTLTSTSYFPVHTYVLIQYFFMKGIIAALFLFVPKVKVIKL